MKPAHNSTYPKVAIQWLNQALCFYQNSCLVDSEVLLNRHLRVATKRYLQPADRKIKINFRHKTSRLDLTKLSRPVCENQIVLSA